MKLKEMYYLASIIQFAFSDCYCAPIFVLQHLIIKLQIKFQAFKRYFNHGHRNLIMCELQLCYLM